MNLYCNLLIFNCSLIYNNYNNLENETKEGDILKVLIIDDAVEICNVLKKVLEHQNYEVDTANDGRTGLRKALSNEYDIILLDIMLPQMNGYRVLQNLRSEGRTTPVIMITARDNVSDKISGLELGADDYLQKPFNMNELTARIRALARRSQINYESNIVTYSDITLKISENILSKEDMAVTLSTQECDILSYMIKCSEVIVSIEKLIDVCKLENDDEKVSLYIKHIQELLNIIKSKVRLIYIKGLGYKLC